MKNEKSYSFIKRVLSRMTIRRKLISIIMFASTLSLFSVGAVFLSWQWLSLKRSMVDSLSTQAKIIAYNCQASVTFDSPDDAFDVLTSLREENTIIFGGVYTTDGEIFACYHRNEEDHNKKHINIQKIGHIFSDGTLTVFEPITVEESVVGFVCLQSSLSKLYSMLEWNIMAMAGTLALVSVLIYLVSYELQKIISAPILDLANVAKTVSEKKIYSTRVNQHSEDEVGLLIKAFNEMLEQIQQRDIALVEANEQLEKKVEERTSDLQEEVVVRKKAEKDLAHTVKKLMLSNRELQEFTRIAAHDLQTPLRAIGILSEWIADDYASSSNEEGQKHALLLQGRAQRISQLINAVMHYSEISLVDKQQERLDLNVIVSEVIENMQIPVNVKITIENRLPVITGISRFIHELFENILTNAIKSIDKSKGLVRIGSVEDGDFWRISIKDNGVGIKEKYFGKIFEIFQMLSLRDETENIGIGLSIAKKIVELYDGRIWVESELDHGSTFYFTLPKSKVKFAEHVKA